MSEAHCCYNILQRIKLMSVRLFIIAIAISKLLKHHSKVKRRVPTRINERCVYCVYGRKSYGRNISAEKSNGRKGITQENKKLERQKIKRRKLKRQKNKKQKNKTAKNGK